MIVKRIVAEDRIETHLLDVDSWDDFDSLAKHLQKEYGAKMIDQTDGIFTRKWCFEIADEVVVLQHHEDIGNYFVSTEECIVLEQIVADLEQRFKQAKDS